MKNKKIILIIGLGIFLLLGIFLAIISNNNSKLTELEQIKIEETSNDIMLFMEEIDTKDSNDIDRYISYALEYSYNVDNKDTLTVKEIKNIIESKINIKLNEEKLNNIGITPYLLDKKIYHHPEEKEYSIDRTSYTQPELAKIPVYSYDIKSIKKEKDSFIVIYNKYKISNPYDILNYYNDNNKDSKSIYNYLTCKGKIIDIKKALNKDNISKIGKIEKELTIKYILKNNKLLIDKL